MKRLAPIALFVAAATSAAAQSISNLPAASSVNATDQYIVNQVGGTGPTGFVTRRATMTQMGAFLAGVTFSVGNNQVLGNITGGGIPVGLTQAQLTALVFGSLNGAVKANGSGVISQAACADLSNGQTGCSTAVGTSGATLPLNNGNNTFSGTDIFTGDALLQSGRPWCDVRAQGAVGDGVTNDNAAFNACITAVSALGGGVVYVPPSLTSYCLFTGITLTGGARIVGADARGSQISACGRDVQLVTIGNSTPGPGRFSGLEHLTIFGKGTNGDVVFGATQKTVVVTTGSGSTVLNDLQIAGGTIPLEINAPDVIVQDIRIGNLQPIGYGNASLHITNGGWYRHLSLDNTFPQSQPATGFASSIAAWASGTGYTAGNIVTLSGYYIQCTTSGTSGGAPPALQNYGINITDNTAVWRLLAPVGVSGILLDGTNAEVAIDQIDIEAMDVGITINNASAAYVQISKATIGANLSGGINATLGQSLFVSDSVIAGGLLTTGSGITFGASWGGDTRIVGNHFILSNSHGILLNGGANTSIVGNQFNGATVSAIGVAAGVSHFQIVGNNFGTSNNSGTNGGVNATPVTIAAGASNDYWIVGNDVSGTTSPISDGGTGAVKYVPDTGTISIAGSVAPTCGTATINVGAAVAKTLGKLTYISVNFTISAIGTCTTPMTFTLPNTTGSRAVLSGQEIVNGFLGVFCTAGLTQTTITCRKNANTAFAVNDQIVLSGTYENQ